MLAGGRPPAPAPTPERGRGAAAGGDAKPLSEWREGDLECRQAELRAEIADGAFAGDVLRDAERERDAVWREILVRRLGGLDDDEPDEPPYPWEIGVDGSCCCESMNVNCDAADPWCTYNPEYREAIRFYARRSKALETGEVLP